MKYKIITKEVDDLLKRVDNMAGYRRGLMAAGIHLQSKVNRYPPRPKGRGMQFTTPKQRRGFFAKLKAGEIEVPYIRGQSASSEQLGQRWVVEQSADGSVTTGNNARYSSLVQGRKQSAFHKKTGWVRFDTVAKAETGTVQKIIMREVERDLKNG